MKYRFATWMMSDRELRLCRYCAACYLIFGFGAGSMTVLLLNWQPLYVLPTNLVLWFVSVHVWEKIARWLVRL
jgi:hypothetical protein